MGSSAWWTKRPTAWTSSEKVATILLKDHVEHCVRESIEKGENADEKIEELTAAVERFLRV